MNRIFTVLILLTLLTVTMAQALDARILRPAHVLPPNSGRLEADSDSLLGYTSIEDLGYFWTLPNEWGDRYYNVWFTSPYENFSLTEVHIPLFDYTDEDGNSLIGEPGLRIIIWQSGEIDSVLGYPIEVIDSLDIPFELLDFTRFGEQMQINVINLSELEISFRGGVDFHIGVDVIQNDQTEQVDTLAVLSDFIDGADRSRLWDGRDERWVRTQDIPIRVGREDVYWAFNYGIWVKVKNDDPEPFAVDHDTHGLWHFNEENGEEAADASPNRFTLTLNDDAGWTKEGVFEAGIDLTADGAGINSTAIIGTGWEEITVEAWIKPDMFLADRFQPVVARFERDVQAAWSLGVFGEGGLYGRIYTNGGDVLVTSAQGLIETDQWYLIAMSWIVDGHLKLWINGDEAGTMQAPEGVIRESHDRLSIGYHLNSDDQFYGFTDEVRVSSVDRYGHQSAVWGDDKDRIPRMFTLYQNHPNPFNPTTTIGFDLATPGLVRLELLDLNGRRVQELQLGQLPVGYHQVEVNAVGLPQGCYLYRLKTGQVSEVKSMILLK